MVVKWARLKLDNYAALLRHLAIVDSAKLKPVEHIGFTVSSNDFWVYARLTTNKKTLVDLNWASYEGSGAELEFVKRRATVRLAQEAIKGLDFKDRTLTDAEREWVSVKFARDWKTFKGKDFHWWVREWYIQTVGVVSDEAVLLVLREILATDPPNSHPQEVSDGRGVYFAINAATRLVKKDVRDQPVEEMEKTRLKVLQLIKDKKMIARGTAAKAGRTLIWPLLSTGAPRTGEE